MGEHRTSAWERPSKRRPPVSEETLGWYLVDETNRIAAGPAVTYAHVEASRLPGLMAGYGVNRGDDTLDPRPAPTEQEEAAARDRHLHAALNHAIPVAVFDVAATDADAALLLDVAATLARAGLPLTPGDPFAIPDGIMTNGVAMRLVNADREGTRRMVTLEWHRSHDADDQTNRTTEIMLTAITEILRVHGFEVGLPSDDAGYRVTGRAE